MPGIYRRRLGQGGVLFARVKFAGLGGAVIDTLLLLLCHEQMLTDDGANFFFVRYQPPSNTGMAAFPRPP